jgi:anaerobic magnesium-protoporphyrin IX monomethyl ester cyclase
MKKVVLVYAFPPLKSLSEFVLPFGPKVKHLLPNSVIALAPYLRREGYEPVLYDARYMKPTDIDLTDVVCVGVSALTGSCITEGIKFVRHVRKVRPELPIVWGGHHAMLTPFETPQSEFVDVLCRQEGEVVFPEIVKALDKGGMKALADVKGIVYKLDGKIHDTPPAPDFDMDSGLTPAYDMCDPERHDLYGGHFQYESSRGCVFRCQFCDVLATHRKTWKPKSAAKVIEDLTYIVEKFHPDEIQMLDDLFFVSKKRAEEICRGIVERGLKFRWSASCRANMFAKFEPEYMELLKAAGCYLILVGAESGSQRMLDKMLKGIKKEDILASAALAERYGIQVGYTFLAGLPDETEADIVETFDVIQQLTERHANVIVSGLIFYSPFPGTPYYDEALRRGWKPPATLEEWGKFRLNRYENIPWHDKSYLRAIEPLCLMSRFGFFKYDVRERLLVPLKRAQFLALGRNLVYFLFFLRKKYRFFKFPVDIRVASWLREQLMHVG